MRRTRIGGITIKAAMKAIARLCDRLSAALRRDPPGSDDGAHLGTVLDRDNTAGEVWADTACVATGPVTHNEQSADERPAPALFSTKPDYAVKPCGSSR
jgi:hypothetical protein